MLLSKKILSVALTATLSVGALALTATPAFADDVTPTEEVQSTPVAAAAANDEVVPEEVPAVETEVVPPVVEEEPVVPVPDETTPVVEEEPAVVVPEDTVVPDPVPVPVEDEEAVVQVPVKFGLNVAGAAGLLPVDYTAQINYSYTTEANPVPVTGVVDVTRGIPVTSVPVPAGALLKITVGNVPPVNGVLFDQYLLLNGSNVPAGGVTVVDGKAYNVSLSLDVTSNNAEPTVAPVAQSDDSLTPETEGAIVLSSSTVKAGDTINVTTQNIPNGTWVAVWLHSTPTLLSGWVTTSVADGHVAVTVPADTPAGIHRVVVTNGSNNIVGWATLTVQAADTTPGGGTGGNNGGNNGGGTGGNTPGTGTDNGTGGVVNNGTTPVVNNTKTGGTTPTNTADRLASTGSDGQSLLFGGLAAGFLLLAGVGVTIFSRMRATV